MLLAVDLQTHRHSVLFVPLPESVFSNACIVSFLLQDLALEPAEWVMGMVDVSLFHFVENCLFVYKFRLWCVPHIAAVANLSLTCPETHKVN